MREGRTKQRPGARAAGVTEHERAAITVIARIVAALTVAHGTAAARRAGRPNGGARDIGDLDDGRDASEHRSRYDASATGSAYRGPITRT